MAPRVRKAVIPAAGLGTRFLPVTKAVPKELLPIVDVPAIQLVVEEAAAAGIEEVVLITGRHKSAIEEHFDRAVELETALTARGQEELLARVTRPSTLARVVSIRQRDPRGLGHAVLSARSVVGDEPFAVLLPDDLFDGGDSPGIGQLCTLFEQTQKSCIGVMEVPRNEVSRYGICDVVAEGPLLRARALVEKPSPASAPSQLAAIGRYVLSPSVWPLLAAAQPGHGGEIQLTDALSTLASGEGLYVHEMQGHRYDTGTQLGFLEANLAHALRRPGLEAPVRALMKRLLSE